MKNKILKSKIIPVLIGILLAYGVIVILNRCEGNPSQILRERQLQNMAKLEGRWARYVVALEGDSTEVHHLKAKGWMVREFRKDGTGTLTFEGEEYYSWEFTYYLTDGNSIMIAERECEECPLVEHPILAIEDKDIAMGGNGGIEYYHKSN